MQRRPDVYLELALLALRKLPRFLQQRSLEAYLADDYCQSAVERQLEIAGDALGLLRRIAPGLFSRVPDGDLIVAFRNVLAHGYAALDHAKVYEAGTNKRRRICCVSLRPCWRSFLKHDLSTPQAGAGMIFARCAVVVLG